MSDHPNIIYLVAHDLGRTLGCYGRPVRSPNLDAFAADSVQFNHAYCTAPACSPSRICAMTGMYPQTSGGYGLAHMGWPLPPQTRTVVDYLNAGGYETVHFGLNHERHAQHNRYQLDMELTWDDYRIENSLPQALAYLQRRKPGRPLYLNIGTQDVHASAWERLTQEQAEARYGRKLNLDAAYIPPQMPDNPTTRLFMAKFQACIAHADEHLGRFFDALQRTDYWNNSVIVFTTDHGIAATRSKGTLYDRGTEIAQLIHLPQGMCSGYCVDHLIPNIDVAATMLDIAGLGVPDTMQGRSFWPLLAGRAYTPNDRIFHARNFHGEHVAHRSDFSDWWDPSRAIRTRDWKYIRHHAAKPRQWTPADPPELWAMSANDTTNLPLGDRPMEELYHLPTDPEEQHNLAAAPEHAPIKEQLRTEVLRWMKETDDPALRGEVPVRYESPGWGDNWPVRQAAHLRAQLAR